MITFTIAKQFQQSTFVSKSKNFKMSLWVCTFRNFRKLTQDKNVFFYSQFQFAWISSVHDNRSKKKATANLMVYG